MVLRQRVYLREIFSWERYGVARDVVLRKTWSCESCRLRELVVVLRETWSREIMDMLGRERALTTKRTAIIISIADTAVHFVTW